MVNFIKKAPAPAPAVEAFDTPDRLSSQIDLAYRAAHGVVAQFVAARDTLLEQAEQADAVARRAHALADEYQETAQDAEIDADHFRRQAEKIADALGLSKHPSSLVDNDLAEDGEPGFVVLGDADLADWEKELLYGDGDLAPYEADTRDHDPDTAYAEAR